MVLLTIIHPINTEAHPQTPPGYRWAVMFDGPQLDYSAPEQCLNAGWCPSVGEAKLEGDQNAATAARGMRMLGFDAHLSEFVVLDHDPVPRHGDRLNT